MGARAVRAKILIAILSSSAILPLLWSNEPALAAPPAGFSDKLVADGLSLPVSMEFAPDGRLFVTEKDGAIRVVKDGALLDQPFATFAVNSEGERGMQGMAFDPDFESNGYLYVYYTTASEPVHNRVSRLTADPANPDRMLAGSERPIIDLEVLVTVSHNGGALEFGPDGRLYITTGDNYHPHLAQSLTSRLGKVLRINADGTIPTDNPFYRTSGAYREIWALGLRNPFTAAVSSDGEMYVNDVGQDTWEEVNVVSRGANFGWPLCEGRCSEPGFEDPIHAYQHPADESGSSIAGGAFYEASQFPSEYRGSYFFGDYVRGFIKMLTPDGQEMDFLSDIISPVGIEVGPEGHLYYLSIGAGEVRRVQFTTAGNYEPVAMAIANQTSGVAPLVVQFDGSRSTDRNNDDLSYSWDFGDGSQAASGDQVTHVYEENGPYVATLTVDDGRGGSNSQTLDIAVGTTPVAQITAPSGSARYDAGDVVSFSGSATDEGEPLPASAYSWKVDFHHNTHIHPFQEFDGVTSGTFEIPTVGETANDVWYRVYLTVTDSSGLMDVTTRDIVPNTSTVTLASNVTGVELTLDGQPHMAPYSFVGVVGAERMVEAPEVQVVGGMVHDFQSWSDGETEPVRTIMTPAGDTRLTALYGEGEPATEHVLSVRSADVSGNPRTGHYVTVEYPRGNILDSGYTPLDFTGYEGAKYTVIIRDYRNSTFDRWEDNSASRVRTVTLQEDMTITAYYRTIGETTEEPSTAPPVTYNLTVSGADTEGNIIEGPYVIIESPDDGTVMGEGDTPLTYTSTAGNTYRVVPVDVGTLVFESWEDGSTERIRTVALDSDVRIMAHYRNATQEPDDGDLPVEPPSDDPEPGLLDRILLQASDIVRNNGGGGSGVRAGEQVDIMTEFTNQQESDQSYAMIIQIEDAQGFTADLGWVTGTLESGETTDASRSWTAPEQGQYTVKMFAWDRVDGAPTPLSEVTMETLSVV